MEPKNSGLPNHWAVAAHLVPFAGAILLYKVLQPSHAFAKDHARASFNFHATLFAAYVAGILPIIIFQLLVRSKIGVNIFAFLTLLLVTILFGVTVYSLIAMIRNAMRASKDLPPQYRFSYPFLK